MKIVALETATQRGSVALLDGERLVERDVDLRGDGALAGLAALLEAEGIESRSVDAIAVSVGPGSFTGVRVGVAAAQGWATATGGRAVSVGTLEAIAAGSAGTEWAPPGGVILPSVDARRGEVYAALYRMSGPGEDPRLEWGPEAIQTAVLVERLVSRGGSGLEASRGLLAGDGAALLAPLFVGDEGWVCPPELAHARAGFVARLAARKLAADDTKTPDELEPVYLRKSDAEIAREKRLHTN